MHDLGVKYLSYSFDMLVKQTFKDFDVVISDHSRNNAIEKLCQEYKNKLTIHYFRNTKKRGSSSANINNAMLLATGRLIKILFQDDYLYHERALEDIANTFGNNPTGWLATACIHTYDTKNYFRPFYPVYDDFTVLKKNSISSPSVITLENTSSSKEPLLFDEELIWWMDLDFYKRCYDRFGLPKIVNTINVVNLLGEHQVTRTLATEERREAEFSYIMEKYNMNNILLRSIHYKIMKYKRGLKKFLVRILKLHS